MKDKVTRKEKIDYLVEKYEVELCKIDIDYLHVDIDNRDVKVLNQIIIDSVGRSGLVIVKTKAWKDRSN